MLNFGSFLKINKEINSRRGMKKQTFVLLSVVMLNIVRIVALILRIPPAMLVDKVDREERSQQETLLAISRNVTHEREL